MAKIDTTRRQQLVGRLKSAIATAAVVGTLGGWIAFGTQEQATATIPTAASNTAPAVAQASLPGSTISLGDQSEQSSSAAATEVAPTATPARTSSPASQSSTTAPSSASSSASTSRRSPVTSTRSSR